MNSMRLRTFCIALLFLLRAVAAAQTADEILAKVLAARGGVDKLRANNSDRVSRQTSFAANSFLLLKWEGKRKYESQEIPVESRFSDYREVGGVKFAFAIDSGSTPTELTQKIRIEKIELNPDLSNAEFVKPPTPPKPSAPAATPAPPPA